MNRISLNRETVNGWVGDATVRIQVLAVAMAWGTMVSRALRRSALPSSASAENTYNAKVLRRSVSVNSAQAQSSMTWGYVHLVPFVGNLIAQATAVITAIGKPPTPIRVITTAAAYAIGVVVMRAQCRSPIAGIAETLATGFGRVGRRSPLSASAASIAFIQDDVNRQIPWDEAAPQERRFIVQPEQHTFTVT